MKITIVRDDNAVYVDGRMLQVDCSQLPAEVNAIQWADGNGVIEYKTEVLRMPQAFIGLDEYRPLIDAWEAARRQADAPRVVPLDRLVAAERDRRLALGFDYDFGDARGVHHIGTTPADLSGWAEVSTYAGALIDSGDTDTLISIATDTGMTQVTAPEWRAIEIASAAFRQPLWAASFALMAMTPIPQDYADDRHWP